MVMIHLGEIRIVVSKVRCKVHHNDLGGSRICDSVQVWCSVVILVTSACAVVA